MGDEALDPYDAVAINNKAARNPFISKQQYDDWIDACRRRKHFQVFGAGDREKSRPLKDTSSGKNRINENNLRQCTDVFGDWVVDAGEKLGADVQVAQKDILRDSGKTLKLTAYSIRDVFDKKNAVKDLPFLSTGESFRSKCTEWVASPKESYVVTSNHLFSNKRASQERLDVEEKLRSNGCTPFTVGQRCVDWFVMKGFILSGTMAGLVFSRSSKLSTHLPEDILYDSEEEEDDDTVLDPDLHSNDEDEVHISDELKQLMLNKCIHSWFGRHQATTSAMAQGTKNEDPTAQKFASMDFVKNFYDVGLLKWDKAENVGVSPDGVAWVKIPGEAHTGLEKQLACVEIKTRVSANTIMKAENAREAVRESSVHGDGKVAVCKYDDVVFKKCVPSANRKQVIHQAVVAGMRWGVFITAKVEETQGSIVQILFVEFSDEQKRDYSEILLRLAKPLSLWIFNRDAIERGYLEEGDCPIWIKSDQYEIIKSRFKLWSALWRLVNENGPLMPLGMLKLSINFDYNKGKWGLDMCTENYHKICFDAVSLLLEGKYVLRLFDGVVGNSWKCEQGRAVIKPYVDRFKARHNGALPSSAQIRSKAKLLSLDDYVYKVALQWLESLERERISLVYAQDIRRFFNASPRRQICQSGIASGADEIVQIIDDRRSKDQWPPKTKRAQQFATDLQLKKVRLFKNNVIVHTEQLFEKTVKCKTGLKSCAMCSIKNNTRMIRWHCSICVVPLCTKVQEGFELSCFDAWHSVENLTAECKKRQDASKSSRNTKRAAKRTREEFDNEEGSEEAEDDGEEDGGELVEDLEDLITSPPRPNRAAV